MLFLNCVFRRAKPSANNTSLNSATQNNDQTNNQTNEQTNSNEQISISQLRALLTNTTTIHNHPSEDFAILSRRLGELERENGRLESDNKALRDKAEDDARKIQEWEVLNVTKDSVQVEKLKFERQLEEFEKEKAAFKEAYKLKRDWIVLAKREGLASSLAYEAESQAWELGKERMETKIKDLEAEKIDLKKHLDDARSQTPGFLPGKPSAEDKELRDILQAWVESWEYVRALQDRCKKKKMEVDNELNAKLRMDVEEEFKTVTTKSKTAEQTHEEWDTKLRVCYKRLNAAGSTRRSSDDSSNSGYTDGTNPGSESTGITVPSTTSGIVFCPDCPHCKDSLEQKRGPT